MEVDDIDTRTDMSVPKKITPIHIVYKSNVNNVTHYDVNAALLRHAIRRRGLIFMGICICDVT